MRACAIVVLAGGLSGPLWAATDAGAPSRLKLGQQVRLSTAGESVAGRIVAIEDGDLVLDSGRRLSIATLPELHVRGRATRRGAVVGAAAGGVALGLVFAAFATFACEDACDGGEWAVGGAVGVAAGGLLGSATGGLVGAALPRWRGLDHAGSAPTGRIGSVSIGLGGGLDGTGAGAGGRFRLDTQLGGWAPGLEVGRYGVGSRQAVSARGQRLEYEESLLHFGPTVTLAASRGDVRPYAVLGAGHYTWTTLDPQVASPWSGVEGAAAGRSFVGGSVGAGVRGPVSGALSIGVEGRWHTNLTRVPSMAGGEPERRLSVLAVTAGAHLSW